MPYLHTLWTSARLRVGRSLCLLKWQGVAVQGRERLGTTIWSFPFFSIWRYGSRCDTLFKTICLGTATPLLVWNKLYPVLPCANGGLRAHTHTAHLTRLHYLTLTFALRLTPALAHTQQQWQGDQPSSDPRKEARWKRSGSGKGPSKPINKPNMPVSTSQRARNIHSMSFHRAFRLFLCLCVCSFLWCSHI